MNAINAASFIADGLTAMNRAAAPITATPRTMRAALQRAEARFRRCAAFADHESLEQREFIDWADEIRTVLAGAS